MSSLTSKNKKLNRFEFTMKNRKQKNRWTCKKNLTFKIPQKKSQNEDFVAMKKKTLKRLKQMSSNERRKLLEENGIINPTSVIPNSLVDTILFTLA